MHQVVTCYIIAKINANTRFFHLNEIFFGVLNLYIFWHSKQFSFWCILVLQQYKYFWKIQNQFWSCCGYKSCVLLDSTKGVMYFKEPSTSWDWCVWWKLIASPSQWYLNFKYKGRAWKRSDNKKFQPTSYLNITNFSHLQKWNMDEAKMINNSLTFCVC